MRGRACPHSSQPGSHSEQRLFLSQSTILNRRPWTWLLWERPRSRCFTPCFCGSDLGRDALRLAGHPASRTSAFPQGPPLALVAVPAANHRHGLQSSRTGALIQIMHHAVCRHGRAAGFSGSARARYPQHGFLAPCGAAPFLVGTRLRANKPASTGLPDQPGPVDCDADLPGQGRHNRSGLPSRGQRCRAQRIFERSRMLGPATMNLP